MPITEPLRFVGTGELARVNVNPRVNREPGRKGVRFSNIDSQGEFKDVVRSELQPSVQELGRNAVQIPRSNGIDLSV